MELSEGNLINLKYNDDNVDDAIEWMKNTNNTIIIPTNTLDELDDLWNKWNAQTKNQKLESDEFSVKLFGLLNVDHYYGLRSRMLNIDDNYDITHKNYLTSKLVMEQLTPLSIFKECIDKCNKNDSYSNMYNTINETEKVLKNISSISPIAIFNAPYFSPERIEEMGTYHIENPMENYYHAISDNKFIDDENKISTREWLNEYKLISKGIITEKSNLYMKLWKNKLYSLYETYNDLKIENNIYRLDSRKQSILELGWNPEVNFIPSNMTKANEQFNTELNDKYSNVCIENIQNYNIDNNISINESSNDDNTLYPIYIFLSYTFTNFGKLITKITNCEYSHAGFSFDTNLNRIFSFNAKNGKNLKGGLSIENIAKYPNKNGQSRIAIFAIFIKKNDLLKLKLKIDEWLNNIKNTSYSFFTAIALLLNKPIQYSTNMICSEFVDSLLKFINVNITDKYSSLVSPKDLYSSSKLNNKIYKVYEGLISKYDPKKIDNLIKRLSNKAKYIKESQIMSINEQEFISILKSSDTIDDIIQLENYTLNDKSKLYSIYENYIKSNIDIKPYFEISEFPIEFDKQGNLLIHKKTKDIDFEKEFADTHKLLKLYSKDNNYAVAYELAKLWYMNLLLEDRIYNDRLSKEELKNCHKARAKILNDFNNYLKELQTHDNMKNFDFEKYYKKTPFGSNKIKISKHTLLYSGKYLKDIIKSLLK